MRPISVIRPASVVFALCLVFPVAAFAQDGKAIVDSMNQKFADAFNAGDIASVARMYTEDAHLLPPGAPMMTGRSEIQKYWEGGAKAIADLTLTAMDVRPLGDSTLREIGTATAATRSDHPQKVKIKYVVIWQRSGGDWKLATDIWNMNP